jgi:hypothetical protein
VKLSERERYENQKKQKEKKKGLTLCAGRRQADGGKLRSWNRGRKQRVSRSERGRSARLFGRAGHGSPAHGHWPIKISG